MATLLHIAHYSGRKIRSVATHTTTYNDTLKIITVNTVYTINLVVQNPVAINNNIYILLQHLTEIITINTAHITNPVAFTSVAIHNVTYCYSTSQTPSQLGRLHFGRNTQCYILLRYPTDIITISTVHITNSVAFTLVTNNVTVTAPC